MKNETSMQKLNCLFQMKEKVVYLRLIQSRGLRFNF
jgi:hypothetical protein